MQQVELDTYATDRLDALARDCEYDPEGLGDEPVDNLIGYKDEVENLAHSALSALVQIARGVPRKDEWRSAAAFMESVAATLDRFSIPRPDHYEN